MGNTFWDELEVEGVDGTQGMFGGGWKSEIDETKLVVGEERLPLPIGLRARAQADGQCGKRATDQPGLTFEGDGAVGSDALDAIGGGILDCGERRRHGPWAGLIAADRGGSAQGIVRAHAVAELAEKGELVPAMGKVT